MLCVTTTMVNCLLETIHQILDLLCGDWVERGCGLIHQQNSAAQPRASAQAKPLLLSAGKSAAAEGM